ncbi:MAG TPA: hypothetical protein VIJ33_08815 [Solirubrobacteraceae bacterium]
MLDERIISVSLMRSHGHRAQSQSRFKNRRGCAANDVGIAAAIATRTAAIATRTAAFATRTAAFAGQTAAFAGQTAAFTAAAGLLMFAIFGGATPAWAAHSVGLGQRSHVGTAHSARALDATDTGRLHYVKSSGSLLLEEGMAQGTLPGSMRASCNLGATVSASFTIYTHGGTIKGHGTATPHGSGIYESFAGTLTVTGGTGRYAHARGHAGLYGTFDRRTYALTLQTTGSLSY